jgi:3-oxoacyl-(acyl-carrier-protein) synthase
MNCYLLQADILRMHPNKVEDHLTPVAKELQEWVTNRLYEIKEEEDEQPEYDDTDIPRNFIAAANRTWFKRSLTTVSGTSIRLPCDWNTQGWYLSTGLGVDYAEEVPFRRWDHADIYDPDPNSWMNPWQPKTSCRHAAFMDGETLFDNKLFGLSLAEVKGMDPSQRLCLEVTYDALHRSGKKKNQLINSTCGMYVGISQSEWNFAERSADVGIFGATGGAPSICAGRLSFCLGCKGASIAIDTECASGLTCVFWAAESVEKKGLGAVQDYACGIGLHLVIAKAWWPAQSAAGMLNPEGRCFSFDQSANGHVRMEGIGTCVVRARQETTEDAPSRDDTLPRDGTIAGGANTNSGQCSSLTSPSGPAMQYCMLESCRKAAIMIQDVEALETFGTGRSLMDAVELTSSVIALRGGKFAGNRAEEILNMSASKTHGGNAIECSGLVGLAMLMHSIEWGLIAPTVHLQQLNGYVDVQDSELQINSETIEYSTRVNFAGVSAFGLGGTNVHLTIYGGCDEDNKRSAPEPTPAEFKPSLAYWPAGGGDVEAGARPRNGYYVIGTFNNWNADTPMKVEDDGVFSYVVALGENRWESFQIQLDDYGDKLLHPKDFRAKKGTTVLGPDEASVAADACWFIDGRTEMVSTMMLTDESASEGAVAKASEELVEWGGEDSGVTGDQYKITMHVAGKWRAVAWSKLSPEQVGTKKEPLVGKYYVAGSFAGWELAEMQPTGPGQWSVQVSLIFGQNSFVILRNADWHQTIYPATAITGSSDAEVLGPEDRFEDLAWFISGRPGEKVLIEFQRAGGAMKVSWKNV